MSEAFPVTDRTRVRRLPERGGYDRDQVYAILDEALICHVGFATDDGPVVIPTIHARHGDTLILHGSAASRMLRMIRDGRPICITVTLIDDLVLARSVFHHSMNYRSVMIFGSAAEVVDADAKRAATDALVERMVPGRSDDARGPSDKEMAATIVLAVPIDEASAKTRTGPPMDDAEDYDLGHWAGLIPVNRAFGPPVPDPDLRGEIPAPDYLTRYRR